MGAGGAVTGITITNPGSGYTSATVNITGAGTGAKGSADVSATGVVTAVSVDLSGAGYTAPVVTISGGGATTDATATAYGGVDVVTLMDPGTAGYQLPTVDFDMPDGSDGVKATAHAVYDLTTGVISEIVVDSPGSGYLTASGIKKFQDGLPMLCNPSVPGSCVVNNLGQ